MKRFTGFLIALFLTLSVVQAAECPSGLQCNATIGAAGSSCAAADAVVLNLTANAGAAVISISGTFTATLQFEQSGDNKGSWVGISGYPQPTGASATSTTAGGTWRFAIAGSTQLCVRASAYTNGRASITINQSPASASIGGTGSVGAAGGDLSGTYPDPTVAQVNGAVVPLSAGFLGSNASRQFIVTPNAAAFSIFGNNTNAPATPAHFTMDSLFGSCSTASSALTFNTTTHAFGCNSISGTGANTALSNLVAVAFNASLVPGAAATYNLGSAPLPLANAFFGNDANKAFTFDVSALTGNKTMYVPNSNATFVVPDTGAANNFVTAISGLGVISKAQPACASLSDAGTGCTGAAISGLTTGTIPKAASASTLTNSLITESAAGIGIGVAAASTELDVQKSISGTSSSGVARFVNLYGTANPTLLYPIISLERPYTGYYAAMLQVGVSRYEDTGTNARTQANFRVSHGNVSYPDTTVLTLKSDGSVIIPSGGNFDQTAGTVTSAWKPPIGAGAAPIISGVCAFDSTALTFACGNGASGTHRMAYVLGSAPSAGFAKLDGTTLQITSAGIAIGDLPRFGSSPAALVVTKAAGADPTTNNLVSWLAGGAIGDSGISATGVAAGTQYGPGYYTTPTTIGSAAPPSDYGSYYFGVDPAGAAAAPSLKKIGYGSRAVTGTTDTILYTDVNKDVDYTGSAAVAVVLPTPTTLVNAAFAVTINNRTTGTATAVTITPDTFTIDGGATLAIAQGQTCFVKTSAAGTAWLSGCHESPLAAGTGITLTRAAGSLTPSLTNTATTPNGQTCTLGSTCNVNNGAAQYSVAVNSAANAAIQGVVVGAGQLLQGAAGANPTGTATPSLGTDNSVAGTLQMANGAANAHTIFGSGATTSNTILGPATVPTTGHLLDCVTSSTTCTLHDSAIVTANVLTYATPATGIARTTSGGQAVVSTELSGDATTSGSNALTLAAKHKTRSFHFKLWGTGTAYLLQDTDDELTIWRNEIAALTIAKVVCECDTGNPTFMLQKDDGGPADMFAAAMTCDATPSGTDGTDGILTSFVSTQNAIAATDRIDYATTTAGGAAHWVAVTVQYTID